MVTDGLQKMSRKEFSEKYKMSHVAALKYFTRGRWTMPDGVTYSSWRDGRKWFASVEGDAVGKGGPAGGGSKPITPEALKAKKTLEEIKLLQNRNERMRSGLMKDWSDICLRVFSVFYGAIAGRIMGLRIDKELAKKLDNIIKEETATIEENLNAALEEMRARAGRV